MDEQNRDVPLVDLPSHWEDLKQLEDALYSYHAWLEDTHRRLICALPPNPDDLQEDAHLRCKFGQWYYSQKQPFNEHEAPFIQIGETHQEMHDELRQLLKTVAEGKKPAPGDYDTFIHKSQAFNNELRALQFEMLCARYQADPLTGALSRHSMMTRLRQEHSRVSRNQSQCTFCMLDFDNFKSINDAYGHPVGDDILQECISRIKHNLREYDLIFRYGGEEFLICFPDTQIDEALEISQRIHNAIRQEPVVVRTGNSIPVTVTMGLAELHPGDSVESCIANADQALLSGKDMGRNRILVWPGHTD